MAVYRHNGMILRIGGNIATSSNCCCDDLPCAKCYEYVDIVLPAFADQASSCCGEIDVLSYQIPFSFSDAGGPTQFLRCVYEKTTGFTNAGCEITKITVTMGYDIDGSMVVTVQVDGVDPLLTPPTVVLHFFTENYDCSDGPWSVHTGLSGVCGLVNFSIGVDVTAGPPL